MINDEGIRWIKKLCEENLSRRKYIQTVKEEVRFEDGFISGYVACLKSNCRLKEE